LYNYYNMVVNIDRDNLLGYKKSNRAKKGGIGAPQSIVKGGEWNAVVRMGGCCWSRCSDRFSQSRRGSLEQ